MVGATWLDVARLLRLETSERTGRGQLLAPVPGEEVVKEAAAAVGGDRLGAKAPHVLRARHS